jgi:hypothetical protein
MIEVQLIEHQLSGLGFLVMAADTILIDQSALGRLVLRGRFLLKEQSRPDDGKPDQGYGFLHY